MRDVTTAFAELRAEFNRQKVNDAKPRRSRDAILRDMIAACDRHFASHPRTRRAGDTDSDYIAPVAARPQNPLRAADGSVFHRAPVGMQPRPGILVSFDAGIKAAAEKMRNAFRPTA
jgi:hypothetical protein